MGAARFYDFYDTGAAAGLLGRTAEAMDAFTSMFELDDDRDWVTDGKAHAHELADLLSTPEQFAAELPARVRRTRAAIGLKEPVALPWESPTIG